MNRYSYCGGDPINFIDPLGLERVVVSGGAFDTTNREYQYEFIETALKKIREWRAQDADERIGWMIADVGWTTEDWQKFQAAIADLDNVHIILINYPHDLINYINFRRIEGLFTDNEGKYC